MTGGSGAGPDPRREEGFSAGAESLILGVLIFVVGTLIVVNAWGVIDAKFATSAAAREAVRAVVESDGSDRQARAEQAARTTLEGHGRDPGGAAIAAIGSSSFERCAEIGYRVEVKVPAIALLGEWKVAEFTVTGEHRELVEPYRAGLEVDPDEGATCVF